MPSFKTQGSTFFFPLRIRQHDFRTIVWCKNCLHSFKNYIFFSWKNVSTQQNCTLCSQLSQLLSYEGQKLSENTSSRIIQKQFDALQILLTVPTQLRLQIYSCIESKLEKTNTYTTKRCITCLIPHQCLASKDCNIEALQVHYFTVKDILEQHHMQQVYVTLDSSHRYMRFFLYQILIQFERSIYGFNSATHAITIAVAGLQWRTP